MVYLMNRWFVILSFLLFQVKPFDFQLISTPTNPLHWTTGGKSINATLWIINDDINKYEISFKYQDAFEHKQLFRAPVYYQKDNNVETPVYKVIVSTRYLKLIVSTPYQIFLYHKKKGDFIIGPIINVVVIDHGGPTEILSPNTDVVVNGTNDQKLLVTWDLSSWNLPTLNDWMLSLIRLGKTPKTIKHFGFVRDFSRSDYGYDFVRREKKKIDETRLNVRIYFTFYDIQEIGYYIPSDELVDGATYRVILKKYHGLEMYTSKKTFKQIGKQKVSNSDKKKTSKILGGIFGGLAAFAVVALMFWYCRKLKNEGTVSLRSETTTNPGYEDPGYVVNSDNVFHTRDDLYPGVNEDIRISYITRNEDEVKLPSYQEVTENDDLNAPPPPYPGLN